MINLVKVHSKHPLFLHSRSLLVRFAVVGDLTRRFATDPRFAQVFQLVKGPTGCGCFAVTCIEPLQ